MERRSPSPETFLLRGLLRDHLEGLASAGVESLPRPRWVAPPTNDGSTSQPNALRQPTSAAVDRPQGTASPGPSPIGPPRTAAPAIRSAERTATPVVVGPSTSDSEPPDPWPVDVRPRAAALYDPEDRPADDGPLGVLNNDSWESLQAQVAACVQCSELAATRKQTVFGVGNPTARLCFLGEAPGADEDRMGEPFVGRAGQLLNKILEACGLQRSEVYILNVLKCRPPGNRNPAPDEAHRCRPFLDRQLALIRPEFLCCLGAVAAQNLLGTTAPIGMLRGKAHTYRGILVYCTYHPAYLLRNPSAKKSTWDDMKLLMRAMGRPVD